MAVDSMLYAADVPAGTYTAGQVIPLTLIRGPAVVRDGYGAAKMKQAIVMSSSSVPVSGCHVTIKNANWNDNMATMVASAYGNGGYTIFAKTSPSIQRCGDVELQPNSAFEVNLVIPAAVTTVNPTSIFALIDIDYPSVQAIANPREESGTPCSIMRQDTITTTLDGTATAMVWNTFNVDEFKAGYRYLLAQMGLYTANTSSVGFVSFGGAPSMNGLVRIIPAMPRYTGTSRLELDYSSALVKGPMEISYAVIDGSSQSLTAYLECDYIRR